MTTTLEKNTNHQIKQLTCICCPMGCPLEVKTENGQIISVSGNTCKRGDEYARKEITAPARTVTTTVKVKNGSINAVSVKTETDIPKEKIFDCICALKQVTLNAPVHIGDVVLENVAGTNVNIIATKNVEIK